MKRPSLDDIRASLWVPPAVAGVAAFAVATVVLRVRTGEDGWLGQVVWPGDRASASTTLQVIAASVITAMTLSFSLVVIALQLASQQFSPRLLRDFARDRVTQGVLSVLFATFVFSLTTLRGLNEQTPVPSVSVFVAFAMGLASMAALLAFLAHIVRTLRVDTMMVAVRGETQAAIEAFYTPYDEPPQRPGDDLPGPIGGQLIPASRSGFLLAIDIEGLVRAATAAEVFVRLGVRPGDHITMGAPIASCWPPGAGDTTDLMEALRGCLKLGYERTRDQDAALGFRQLSDIAVKALSPGINDPGTAVHAIGYLADLLVRLCGRSLGPGLHIDDAGVPRVEVPGRDLRYYLDQACGLIRRFARREPIVLVALLSMLRDVAVAVRDDDQRAEVDRQVGLILEEMADDLIADDVDAVHDLAARVRRALDGDVDGAFADRSGETRSA